MKNKYMEMKGRQLVLLVLFLLICIARCKDEQEELKAEHDPSLPVEVAKFTPDSGGAATQLLIYGSNFGTDTSKIFVTINGKKAPVVGCNGEVIYALVQPKTRIDSGFCDVKIRVGTKEEKCEKQFFYAPHYMVSTLAGEFVDENRGGSIVDGLFAEARFNEPYWLAFDSKKNLFLIEEDNGLRYIDLEAKKVDTKFRTGSGMGRPRTIAFTRGFDTMIVAHDAAGWTDMGQAMLTNADGFKGWTTICQSKQCNGGAFHPVHYDYYFNSYEGGQVYKITNRSSSGWSYGGQNGFLFKVGDVKWEFNIQFAPSGDFAYFVSINQHYVLKSTYSWERRVLEPPIIFAGTKQKSGYADGLGQNAQFDHPHQGAFDEHNNFYLCDAENQCIRKITPDGIVTTFAGRPNEYGYVDGELRTAQFDQPEGIVYDKDTKTFYVADQKNRRIRIISPE
jgi:hypothetical protein